MRVTIIHAVQSAPYEYVQKKGKGCFQIKLRGVFEIKVKCAAKNASLYPGGVVGSLINKCEWYNGLYNKLIRGVRETVKRANRETGKNETRETRKQGKRETRKMKIAKIIYRPN